MKENLRPDWTLRKWLHQNNLPARARMYAQLPLIDCTDVPETAVHPGPVKADFDPWPLFEECIYYNPVYSSSHPGILVCQMFIIIGSAHSPLGQFIMKSFDDFHRERPAKTTCEDLVGLIYTSHVKRDPTDIRIVKDIKHDVFYENPFFLHQDWTVTTNAGDVATLTHIIAHLHHYLTQRPEHPVEVTPSPSGVRKALKTNKKKPWLRADLPSIVYMSPGKGAVQQKREHQGGTHASPLGHQRKGHWRYLRHPRFKTQRYIRVAGHWVGPSEWEKDGAIYKVKAHQKPGHHHHQ